MLFISVGVFAQKANIKKLETAVSALDVALLEKDTINLKMLLSDNIAYGHSNGWIETKREMVDDLFSGKLTYKQITTSGRKIKVEGNVAIVRMNAGVDIVMSSTPLQFKLSVLQVWQWKHRHWVLIARQSVKM